MKIYFSEEHFVFMHEYFYNFIKNVSEIGSKNGNHGHLTDFDNKKLLFILKF